MIYFQSSLFGDITHSSPKHSSTEGHKKTNSSSASQTFPESNLAKSSSTSPRYVFEGERVKGEDLGEEIDIKANSLNKLEPSEDHPDNNTLANDNGGHQFMDDLPESYFEVLDEDYKEQDEFQTISSNLDTGGELNATSDKGLMSDPAKEKLLEDGKSKALDKNTTINENEYRKSNGQRDEDRYSVKGKASPE